MCSFLILLFFSFLFLLLEGCVQWVKRLWQINKLMLSYMSKRKSVWLEGLEGSVHFLGTPWIWKIKCLPFWKHLCNVWRGRITLMLSLKKGNIGAPCRHLIRSVFFCCYIHKVHFSDLHLSAVSPIRRWAETTQCDIQSTWLGSVQGWILSSSALNNSGKSHTIFWALDLHITWAIWPPSVHISSFLISEPQSRLELLLSLSFSKLSLAGGKLQALGTSQI